jgi:hypothetical protein
MKWAKQYKIISLVEMKKDYSRFVGHEGEVTITYQPPDYKKQLKERRKKRKERKI